MDTLAIDFQYTPADKRDPMSQDDVEISFVLLNGERIHPQTSERLLVEFIHKLKEERKNENH